MSDGDATAPTADRPDAPRRLECPAYSLPAKVFASAVVAALAVALWQSAGDIMAAAWTAHEAAALLVMGAAVFLGYGWILASRTAIDATGISQTWIWPKRVRLADIEHAKFIYVPGLAWLIAPRLVVRARGQRRAVVFPAAGHEVLVEFARLSLGPAAPPRP